MHARTLFRTWFVFLFALLSPAAWAQDTQAEAIFYSARLADLDLVEESEAESESSARQWVNPSEDMFVRLDGMGEAWIFRDRAQNFLIGVEEAITSSMVTVQAPRAESVSGRVYITSRAEGELSVYGFTLGTEHIVEGARAQFFRAKADHYSALRGDGRAGSAWFRYREQQALKEVGEEPDEDQNGAGRRRIGELDETYDVFTGGRAVSENLQLDQVWVAADGGEFKLPIAEIEGIDVREFDWTERVKGLEPKLDALAAWVPNDQHGVFFPSFQAMVDVLDESLDSGTLLVRLVDTRAEDARTRERYERQLCVALNPISRALGSAVVESVALTGSDPYLRTGTDVALLFDCKDAGAFFAAITANQSVAATMNPAAVRQDHEALAALLGLAPDSEAKCSGVRTESRELCSYAVQLGTTVVVSNSLVQLERILQTQAGSSPALSASPEYRFFRDRYPRGTNDEGAFLMLTDAAIRRWCSPRWRIGAARRLRASALLSELQAELMPALVRGEGAVLPEAGEPYTLLGELSVNDHGANSAIYGDLAFQTPILELELELATRAEKSAYTRFKRRYQREWRTFFDPIALQFQRTPERLGFDLSVMPLIEQTEYSRLIDLTGDVQLEASSGDPHAKVLFHYVMALSTKGPTFNMGRGMAGMFMPEVEDPFGWIGESAALYVDQDELWEEMLAAEDREQFLEDHLSSLPVGLHVAVAKPLLLVAFLTSLRGYADQAAPGMADWQNREHSGQTYVSVGASEEFATDELEDLRIHYVALPSGLTLSLNESVIHRAIDRHQARKDPEVEVAEPTDWLGKSSSLRVGPEGFRTLLPLWDGVELRSQLQRRSWSNLPILNEWKRLYPDRDPVEVHEKIWFTRLVCPLEGEYSWNAKLQTMESTTSGSPMETRAGGDIPLALRKLVSLDFGLTFEDDGLRARSVIQR